jgi:hypothetical protein
MICTIRLMLNAIDQNTPTGGIEHIENQVCRRSDVNIKTDIIGVHF